MFASTKQFVIISTVPLSVGLRLDMLWMCLDDSPWMEPLDVLTMGVDDGVGIVAGAALSGTPLIETALDESTATGVGAALTAGNERTGTQSPATLTAGGLCR